MAREAKQATSSEQLRKFKTDLLAREAAHKKSKAAPTVQKEFGEAMLKVEWVSGCYTRQMIMELFEDYGPIHEVVMLPEKSKAFVIFLHNGSAVSSIQRKARRSLPHDFVIASDSHSYPTASDSTDDSARKHPKTSDVEDSLFIDRLRALKERLQLKS